MCCLHLRWSRQGHSTLLHFNSTHSVKVKQIWLNFSQLLTKTCRHAAQIHHESLTAVFVGCSPQFHCHSAVITVCHSQLVKCSQRKLYMWISSSKSKNQDYSILIRNSHETPTMKRSWAIRWDATGFFFQISNENLMMRTLNSPLKNMYGKYIMFVWKMYGKLCTRCTQVCHIQ